MNKIPCESNLEKDRLKVRIGKKAPDFTLETSGGGSWTLSKNQGKVIALLFYPKNETLVCTKQMCSVRDNWKEYLETEAEIIGISPGTAAEHKEFGKKYELPFILLADVDRKITQIYGSHWLFPTFFMRTVVVIDAKSVIRSKQVMLRAFRPTDRSVIRSIYAAKADALEEKYRKIISRR